MLILCDFCELEIRRHISTILMVSVGFTRRDLATFGIMTMTVSSLWLLRLVCGPVTILQESVCLVLQRNTTTRTSPQQHIFLFTSSCKHIYTQASAHLGATTHYILSSIYCTSIRQKYPDNDTQLQLFDCKITHPDNSPTLRLCACSTTSTSLSSAPSSSTPTHLCVRTDTYKDKKKHQQKHPQNVYINTYAYTCRCTLTHTHPHPQTNMGQLPTTSSQHSHWAFWTCRTGCQLPSIMWATWRDSKTTIASVRTTMFLIEKVTCWPCWVTLVNMRLPNK